MIKIVISGIPETQTMLNNIVNQSPNNSKVVLTEVSDYMVNQAKNNSHVITGKMKGNISANIQDKKATVTSGANYSIYENKRAGSKGGTTHDFWDRALQSTLKEIPTILRKHTYRWTGTKTGGKE